MKRYARQRCRFAAHMIAMGIGALASLRLLAQESPPAAPMYYMRCGDRAEAQRDVQKVPIAISVLSGAEVRPQEPYRRRSEHAGAGLQVVSSGPLRWPVYAESVPNKSTPMAIP